MRRLLACVGVMGVLGGCASFEQRLKESQQTYLTGSPEGRPVPGPATPPPPTAQVLQGPAPCPDAIAREAPLEQDYGARLHAGNWVPTEQLPDLGFTPGPEASELFKSELPLAEGRVVALGLTHGKGAGLVLLRPLAAGGYCVVNHWASFQAEHVDYALAGAWTAPDARLSILLLKLVVAPGTVDPRTHWVVLGTDGKRAWYALGDAAGAHLLAPAVSLVPSGKKLSLDVTLSRTSRFTLGKDGRFASR